MKNLSHSPHSRRHGFSLRVLAVALFATLSAPVVHADFEFSGSASGFYRAFGAGPSYPPESYQGSGPKLLLEPTFQWKSESFRMKATGAAIADQTYRVANDQYNFIAEDLFVEFRHRNWNLLTGFAVLNWGITDVLNPLDVVNSHSYHNPLAPKRMGSPMVALAFTRETFSADLVFIPNRTPPQLPLLNGRYFPRDISFAQIYSNQNDLNFVPVLPPQALQLSYNDRIEYDHPFRNNLALRLHAMRNQFEAYLIAFDGAPQFPDLHPPVVNLRAVPGTSDLELDPVIGLTPRYQRVRSAAAGLVYSFESWIVRAVYADTWQTSANIRTVLPRSGVIALEKGIMGPKYNWTILLQYTSQTDAGSPSTNTYSTVQIFDQSLMAGVRLASEMDFSILLSALVSPKQGQIFMTDLAYRLNDRWHLKAIAQLISGKPGTLLKSLEPASNFEAGIQFFW